MCYLNSIGPMGYGLICHDNTMRILQETRDMMMGGIQITKSITMVMWRQTVYKDFLYDSIQYGFDISWACPCILVTSPSNNRDENKINCSATTSDQDDCSNNCQTHISSSLVSTFNN